jgi:hypothetical protein
MPPAAGPRECRLGGHAPGVFVVTRIPVLRSSAVTRGGPTPSRAACTAMRSPGIGTSVRSRARRARWPARHGQSRSGSPPKPALCVSDLLYVSDLEKHRRAVEMTVQLGAIAQVSGGHSTDADGARLATLWRSAAGCVLNVHRGRIAGSDGPASRAVSSGLRLQVPFCRMAGGTWVSHAPLVSADRSGQFSEQNVLYTLESSHE